VDSKSVQTGYRSFDTVVAPAIGLIPYYQHINPIRAALINVYMPQAICRPCCKYHPGLLLVPQYTEPVIASTYCELPEHTDIPGLNLLCVFMNMEWTYQDGVVMSRTAASRFSYIANVSVYLDPTRDNVPIHGTVVEPYGAPWWENHFAGRVCCIEPTSTDKVRVVVSANCLPVNGDKFTTLHGQKGVVTILEDSKMPTVKDMVVDMVIGSSSIVGRQTASQLLEAAYNQYYIDHMPGVSNPSYEQIAADYRRTFNVRTMDPTTILPRYEADVYMDGHIVKAKKGSVHSKIVSVVPVRANYGTIRVMQSSFLASFRMSSTYSLAGSRTMRAQSRSSMGGSRSLGEMEVMQLLASGMTHTLTELSVSSDMIRVNVCRVCRCLEIMCECVGDHNEFDIMRISNKSVKFIVANYVAYRIKVALH